MNTAEITNVLWKFARGDANHEPFEKWLYSNDEIEGFLGPDLYLELISCDFLDKDSVWTIRQSIADKLDPSRNCECPTIKDLDFIPMGFDGADQKMFANLTEVLEFGEEKRWLYISRCDRCDTLWMIGQDDLYYDDYYLKRIKEHEFDKAKQGQWPELFLTKERLLALGRDLSSAPIYAEADAPSLLFTVQDLVKERPSITAEQIANIMDTSVEHATLLLEKNGES
jgi:hypothetical protein